MSLGNYNISTNSLIWQGTQIGREEQLGNHGERLGPKFP